MTVETHVLPNGLRIAVEPMPGLRSASIGVFLTAGGRHERVEQNGIAHFLEHMAFKGTPTRTALRNTPIEAECSPGIGSTAIRSPFASSWVTTVIAPPPARSRP